jgi:hypothetical protein
MKLSTGAAVRDHRNAVRDRSESLSAFNRIAVRNRRNPQPGAAAMPNMESKPMDMTPKVTSGMIALVVALSFVVLIIGVSIGLSFA